MSKKDWRELERLKASAFTSGELTLIAVAIDYTLDGCDLGESVELSYKELLTKIAKAKEPPK